MKLIVATVLAGLVASQGAIASRGSSSTRPSTSHEQTRNDPWSGLFRVTPIEPKTPTLVTVIPVEPQAIDPSPRAQRGPCNMPIVPANPDVDRRMIVPIPSDRADAKIRVIEPTVCGTPTRR